jgi:hypothetical protein
MIYEFSNIANSYGLYCNNAYLEGTLISATKDQNGELSSLAGLTSTDIV